MKVCLHLVHLFPIILSLYRHRSSKSVCCPIYRCLKNKFTRSNQNSSTIMKYWKRKFFFLFGFHDLQKTEESDTRQTAQDNWEWGTKIHELIPHPAPNRQIWGGGVARKKTQGQAGRVYRRKGYPSQVCGAYWDEFCVVLLGGGWGSGCNSHEQYFVVGNRRYNLLIKMVCQCQQVFDVSSRRGKGV